MGNYIGCYPAEYNPKVHGPYLPGRYYGPRDVPFGELKLVDVPAWLSRRTFNPYRTVNRAFWRWNIKYFDVKKGGLAWTMQLAFVISFTTFIIRYDHHRVIKCMERKFSKPKIGQASVIIQYALMRWCCAIDILATYAWTVELVLVNQVNFNSNMKDMLNTIDEKMKLSTS